MRPVRIVPPRRDYPRLYANERRRLARYLAAELHHVGSTAVPGLAGKGFIDILAVVPARGRARAKAALERAGYGHVPDGGDEERMFFRRVAAHTYHLHLVAGGAKTIWEHLRFRGMLRKDAELRGEYEREKRRLYKACRTRREFRHRKGRFIARAMARFVAAAEARKW